jgi:hypothetical protein
LQPIAAHIPPESFFLSQSGRKAGFAPETAGTAKIGPVRPRSNLAATRATCTALKADKRLCAEHAGLETLALWTAKMCDSLGPAEKRYVAAALSRAHLLNLQALLLLEAPGAGDAFDQLLASMAVPTLGGASDENRWE